MSERGKYLSRAPRFEPPIGAARAITDAPYPRPECRPGARHVSAPRRTAHSGRSPRTAGSPTRTAVSPTAPSAPLTDVRRFTEHALRRTLEVLDRRRAPEQLRPLLSAPLVDLVRTLPREAVPGRSLGAATLQRIHLRAHDPNIVEVFGSYARGPRIFAIAARVERSTTTRPSPGWVLTSLRIA